MMSVLLVALLLVTIEPGLSLSEVIENNSASIQCGLTGCTVTWTGPAVDSERAIVDERRIRIENALLQDRGNYTCSCDERTENHYLNVIRPPQVGSENGYHTFQEGDLAKFRCPANPGDPVKNPQWLFNDMSLLPRHHTADVYLQINRISMEDEGTYKCWYNLPSGYFENYVNVTVTRDMGIPAKPEFDSLRQERTEVVEAKELKILVGEEVTQNRPHADSAESVRIQWRREDTGELVDFGSRLNVNWEGHRLHWSIQFASLADKGLYRMNVSNDYGSTELLTTLMVIAVDKSEVNVHISGQECEFLKSHSETLAREIADVYLVCRSGCPQGLLDTVDIKCNSEDESATVSMRIPTGNLITLPRDTISFVLDEDVAFVGVIMHPSTTIPPSTFSSISPGQRSSDTVLPIAVVAAVALLLLTVVLALVLAVYITKCRNNRQTTINPEAPQIDNQEVISSNYDKVQQNDIISDSQSCISSAGVVALSPVEVQPSKDQLPLSQQLYIPPSPVSGNRKSPILQEVRTSMARPKDLFFRSHSYSYSVRTPPDPKSKP